MRLLDNTIILMLIVLAFYAGKKISDSYHEKRIDELKCQIRVCSMEKGIGYPPVVPVPQNPVGPEFMERLKKTGRATQILDTSNK